MTPHECHREPEVLDALAAGDWRDAARDELRAHAACCPSCTDLLAVAIPLLDDCQVAQAHPDVPSAAIVWWKAQRRAREEAARAAERPVFVVQCLALACALGLLAGVARLALPTVTSLGTGASDGVSWLRSFSSALPTFAAASLLPWIALVALLLLAPVAVYLATASD